MKDGSEQPNTKGKKGTHTDTMKKYIRFSKGVKNTMKSDKKGRKQFKKNNFLKEMS